METALLIGLGAFVILGVMIALLWLSSRREEREDTVTQEIISRATMELKIQRTQEEEQ